MNSLKLSAPCIAILGLAAAATAQTTSPPATIEIPVVLRDISHLHPNFEEPVMGLKKGIVKDQLGVDGLPVWNATQIAKTFTCLTNEADFNTWWMDKTNISKRIDPANIIGGQCKNSKLTLTRDSRGFYVYDSTAFFPLATANLATDAALPPFSCGSNTSRNYHFTMELHNEFTYRPGQVFDFRGDDDVWVFINNKLVIDIGGVHGPIADSINLDTLGLTAGKTYPLDLFFAERHTTGSNFRMTTDIVFTPEPVIDSTREFANTSPTVALPNEAVKIESSRSVTLSPTVNDDALPRSGGGTKCQWTMEQGPGNVLFTTPTEPTTQVKFPAEGQYALRLTVSDSEYKACADMTVKVEAANIGTITTTVASDDSYTNAHKIWDESKSRLCVESASGLLPESKRGFDDQDYHLDSDSEVIVTAIYDGSRARNSLCWYQAGSPTNLIPIWHDYAIGPLAPLWVGKKTSLGILPAGTDLRFALICDGARKGTDKLYMDPELNVDRSSHIAGRLFSDVAFGERPLVIAWEDIEFGPRCDNDFNDVVYQVEIIPVRISDTQYDNVIDGKKGINSNLGPRGVAATLAKQGVAAARYETAGELYYIPPTAGNFTINLIDERSSMKTEVRVFDYDSVRGLNPDSLEFRVKAARNSFPLFDERSLRIGGSVSFTPSKYNLRGKTIGLMFIPNNIQKTFLTNPWRYTPKGEGNRTKRQPLFSLISANPGQMDQSFSFANSKSSFFFFEEMTRYNDGIDAGEKSDSSFDDLMFKISPPLQISKANMKEYYQATPDTTYGYDTEAEAKNSTGGLNEDCGCTGDKVPAGIR